MKLIIIIILSLICYTFALTCNSAGNTCPSAEICSAHCKQLGRKGGSCSFSNVENRCICYCYTSKISFTNYTKNESFSTGFNGVSAP